MINKYIAIEGVIGVGKTTLTRLLQPHFNANVLLEVVEDNPFLTKFYQDRERYAFQTQIFFLLSRYHQQYQAVPAALQRGNLISDYTFAKDELFAWLNLKDDELAMYGRVHAALGEKIPRPDLILYLRADHDVLMRRIAHRDRPFERDIDPDYIREVASAYDAWLSRMTDVPVLTIETNELDYLSHPADLIYITEAVTEALAHALPPGGSTDAKLRTLQQGRVAAFQQFHRDSEPESNGSGNPFYRYLLLVEEVGELTSHLVKMWPQFDHSLIEGNGSIESVKKSIETSRPALRDDLADLLAHILRLANDFGIDLEQAYLDKIRLNLGRPWPVEPRGPEQGAPDRGELREG